ncbi:MAG: SRPBCC family protein [Pseudomonadota bacterium]
MTCRSLPSVLLLLLGLSPAGGSAAGWDPLEATANRAIPVEVAPRAADEVRAVSAAVLIDAGAEPVWEAMVDCGAAPEFVPGLKACSVLETAPDGLSQSIAHEVRYGWFLPRVRYVFDATYQPLRRVDFEKTSGDLRHLSGAWTLEALAPASTLVTYSVRIDPGFLVPQWMVRNALKRDLPELLEALRQRVEAGL